MRSSFFALAAVFATATALSYDNPVLDASAPDPGVLFYQNKWWAAVTSNGDVNHFPLYSSDDLVSWKFETHLIPQGKEPAFCHDKNTDYWAPELHVGPAGDLFCYFVCRGNNGVLTVGVMVSPSGSPLGPWSDGSILVGDMSDGQIDASFFYVNATRQAYAIWKEDSNSIGKPTHIWIANTTDKATSVTSKPISLIYNDSPWEGAVTEGPWIIQDRGYFYLFYSGNAYNTKAYAIGVARATTITGPYEKYSKNPILHTDYSVNTPKFYGPGHCSVVKDEATGEWRMMYHAWNVTGSARVMLTDKLTPTSDGWWSIGSPEGVPSTTVQPLRF